MNKLLRYLSVMACGTGCVCVSEAQQAQIGDVSYATLAEAFAAATTDDVISVLEDVTVDAMIPVTQSVTLNLNGHTITNNVTENRMFRLSDVTFTINGDGGKVITPESNTQSYGFVDFRDAAGVAGATTSLIVNKASFEGATDEGSLFAFRGNGQSIDLNDVDVNLTGGYTYSIINGYHLSVKVNVSGGTYTCNSTHQTAGVFQAGSGSEIEFTDVTVNSSVGPVFEVQSEATFTNCTMTNTATNTYFASCIATAYGATANVNNCNLTANYPLYVYNSGGTINVDGGTYTGNVAAIKVDGKDGNKNASVVNVTDGTFNGAVQVDALSELHITGGQFTEDVMDYTADNAVSMPSVDADGNAIYVVLPADTDAVALIGTTVYTSLADAFAAVQAGQTISLVKDVDVDAMIPVTQSVTLNLNGHTITNNVTENRPFCLSDVTFTINGDGGKVIIPESNTKSYGFVDFRDAAGVAVATTSLIVNKASFEGATDGASFFKFRSSGQSIELNDVDVNLTTSETYSIINGYQMGVKVKVTGGTYTYDSIDQEAGVFQAGAGSEIEFKDVTVNSTVGPVFEVILSEATFTNCTMTNTATNSYYAACIAPSNGSTVNVKDCNLTANYPLYVYNSGGTINVDGGTYTGNVAAIKVDGHKDNENKSVVNVTDGTFYGAVKVDALSELHLTGGAFTDSSAGAYCDEGYTMTTEPDADGLYIVKDDDIPTSVDGIVSDSDSLQGPVYNAQGIYVGTSLEGLAPGLYIVKGKKVLVRY